MPTDKHGTNAGEQDRLRVIIVGGSIAGLTLAHSLHNCGVDFVVLEAAKDIAPQVGASIVTLPNGARILDQLGMFEDILQVSEKLTIATSWMGDSGKKVLTADIPMLIEARSGYPGSFMERRALLHVLFKHIHDKSKVLTSKRVCEVEHNDDGVIVRCEDGSSYSGDIVVGADGIHSTVRRFMQQHIEENSPGKVENDKQAVTAEYNCIFGIGGDVAEKLTPGHSYRSYANGHSSLLFVGNDHTLYWFLFSKLDKKYTGKDIPRYTKLDLDEAIKPFLNMHVTDTVKFDEVWDKRTTANMVCMEESEHEFWTSDRFVCIGDAIHKVTANAGAGGNAAIESAAALANSLSRLRNTKQSLQEIRRALSEFHEKRQLRAKAIIKRANELTRLEALATIKDQLLVSWVVPHLGDLIADRSAKSTVGAELLEFLPEPKRSLEARMPWDPTTGLGKEKSKALRVLYALPLLLVLYGCHQTMGATIDAFAIPLTAPGTMTLSPGVVIPLQRAFFGLEGFDNFISKYVAFFTPVIGNFDSIGKLQALAFLGDLIPIQVIWMIEGIRRGNAGTAASLLPTIFGALYQIRGIGYLAPLYYFLHYVQSPLEQYAAPDNRMTQTGPVKTIIPTIVLSYILPSLIMFLAPNLAIRQWVNGLLWQPFPLYAAILQRLFGRFVSDTTVSDRLSRTEADMPYLRAAYGFAATVAACGYLYVWSASPISMWKIFFEGLANPTEALPLIKGATKALKYDQISAFAAGAIWILLSFGDLKKAGKLGSGWVRIVGVFAVTTLITGPGAAMAVMWAWREEILAKRRSLVLEKK